MFCRSYLAVTLTKYSRVFVLLALTSGMLCAQEYSFRYFGATEGLTNLVTRGIYQDRVGFIWVSTENGIFRYDGDRFEPFGPAKGLPANFGATFGDAPDGSLLAGGSFGLYHLSGNRFEKSPGGCRLRFLTDCRLHRFADRLAGRSHLLAAKYLVKQCLLIKYVRRAVRQFWPH